MSLIIEDKGHRNRVEISSGTMEKLHGVLRLHGDDSVVRIADQSESQKMDLDIYGGAQLTVGQGCRLGALRVYASGGATVIIGGRTIFNGRTRLLMHEAARISIGDRCLFGGDCTLTVSDMHSILDATTRERLNPKADIEIADHVWIGESVMVLKGSRVARDCVIGARALVSGAIPGGSLAVGVPAKVVREGVTWDNRLL